METPRGNLSQIMRHINGAYTTYFNVKRKRAGHLFQGRYKAILVDADAYAAQLARYIHLNPVRAAMVQKPQDYPWSSYLFTIGQSQPPPWLERHFILGYFGGNEQGYRAFVEDLPGKEHVSPLLGTTGATILGGDAFIAGIRTEHLETKKIDRDVPALKQLLGQPDLDAIVEKTSEVFGEGKGAARQAALYVCHRYSGAKLKEIGSRFEVSESAVTQASRRFAARLEEDEEVNRAIGRMVTELNLSKV
nr:transposase [Desulfuromonas soudanensis]